MSLGAGTTIFGYWNATFNSITLTDGNYNISVNATDPTANTNISQNISITIDNTAVNVSIITPTNDTTLAGNFLINASVNDSSSGVFNVTFRLISASGTESSWLYAELNSGTIDQGYWNTTVDITALQNGKYNITVNATDFAGNQILANISRVLIDNPVVGQCGDLVTTDQTYTLTTNVTDTNTCFTITAPGITLDCGGFTIDYASSEAGFGVDIQANTSTIRNCIFNQSYERTYSPAIYASNINNSIIINNTINVTGDDTFGIQFIASNFTNITNNRINTSGNNGQGIGLQTSRDNNITQNNINTRGGTRAYGINLTDSDNSNIISNNVTTDGTSDSNIGIYFKTSTNNNVTSNTVSTNGTSSNYGIFLETNADNNIVANNNVSTHGTSTFNSGIRLASSDNNNLSNNVVNSNGSNSAGIRLDAFADDNIITTNKITTGAGVGFMLQNGLSGNTFTNNIIYAWNGDGVRLSLGPTGNTIKDNNITTNGGGAGNTGIDIFSSDGNTFINNNVTTNGTTSAYGISVQADSNTFINNVVNVGATGTNNYALRIRDADNNQIINGSLTSASASDIFVRSGTPSFTNFIVNTTYDKTDIAFQDTIDGHLYNQYFLIVNVTDTDGLPLDGAWVNVSSDNNRAANTVTDVVTTTNSNGQTTHVTLSEFLANSTFQTPLYLNFNNYTINVSYPGYETQTNIPLNLTSSREVLVQLADNTAPNATIIIPATNANISGSFLANASINDSASDVNDVNLSLIETTETMTLAAGSLTNGYFNVTIITTSIPDGNYNLSVNATDAEGNTDLRLLLVCMFGLLLAVRRIGLGLCCLLLFLKYLRCFGCL